MTARGAAESDPGPARPGGPVAGTEHLRGLHMGMVEAVLSGDGLERVAAIAAGAVGSPVAIAVPRLGTAVIAPAGRAPEGALDALREYAGDRVRDRPSRVPASLAAEVPVRSGDELVGVVALVRAEPSPDPAAAMEILQLAAVATLTEVAVEEARLEVADNLRGSFLEELRDAGEADAADVVRRAGRLGCDLARGAVVLCAQIDTQRPRHLAATVSGDWQGALAQVIDQRLYAVLPAAGGDGAPEATLARARALADRLRRHGPVAVSSFYADPAELPRAIQEAELVLDVVRRSGLPVAEDIGTGTYRLLFRVLASHPEEVRSFYEDTIAPVVRYDDQYRTDLVGTLSAYLEQNCNMNATAAAIYAHRHTVAYRLDRVKELTGLDPMVSEDRERLGLGLKAYRIIAPRLPK